MFEISDNLTEVLLQFFVVLLRHQTLYQLFCSLFRITRTKKLHAYCLFSALQLALDHLYSLFSYWHCIKSGRVHFWLIKCHSLSQHYWSVLRRLGISCYLPYTQPCCLLSCGVSASSGRAKATDHEIFHFPSKTRFSSSAAKKKHHSDECAIRLIKSLLVVHRIHWRKWGQGRKEVVYMSSGQSYECDVRKRPSWTFTSQLKWFEVEAWCWFEAAWVIHSVTYHVFLCQQMNTRRESSTNGTRIGKPLTSPC